MPLYKSIHFDEHTRIHLWKLTETEEELHQGIRLKPSSVKRVESMKSEIHRKGYLSIRHLLKIEEFTDDDLYYDDQGKPHLENDNYISITHSFEFTAIILSANRAVGIDIEKQRPKILKIAHKFSTYPLLEHQRNDAEIITKLTCVWGAKESIYKIYPKPGLSFLQHIDIDDFHMVDEKTTGHIHFNDARVFFEVHFEEVENYCLVYALA
jgi:phosphopantetheinyl transferase